MRLGGILTLLSTFVIAISHTARLQENKTFTRVGGVVLDATTGRPLSDVRIFVNPGSLTTSSDSEGRFSIEGPAAGAVVLYGDKPGYIALGLEGRLIPGQRGLPIVLRREEHLLGLVLRLRPAGILTGRVVDVRGEPVQGVSVVPFRLVYDDIGGRSPQPFSPTKTNDRGDFRLSNLEPAAYGIRFEPEPLSLSQRSALLFSPIYFPGVNEFVRAAVVEVNAGMETRIGSLALPPLMGTSLRVRVVDSNGNTRLFPNGSTLSIRRQGEVIPVRSGLLTSTTEIGALPFGIYEIHLRAPSIPPLRFTVNLESGSGSEVTLTVPAVAPSVVGDINIKESAGGGLRPASGVRVQLLEAAQPFDVESPLVSYNSSSSNERGSFVISSIASGQYRIRFHNLPKGTYIASARSGDRDVLVEGLEVREGLASLSVILGDRAATVGGTVKDSTGKMVPGAIVVLVPENRAQSHFISGITDGDGYFELTSPPGNFECYTWLELEGAAFRNAEFMRNYEGRGVRLRLEQGARTVVAAQALR